MAVVVTLLALVAPAVTGVNSARQVTVAAYEIEGTLDTARAYAKANGTYTWVGFFEEDGSQSSRTPALAGSGRVIVSTVASKDATAMYPSNGDQAPLTSSNLVQVGNLLKIDNAHLDVLAQSDVPTRTVVDDPNYQVGSSNFNSHDAAGGGTSGTNKVTFTYPVSGNSPKYTFVKAIQFGPLGDAVKIVESPVRLVEIGLRPARGATVIASSKNCVALQVAGIGGAVRIYQP